MRCLFTTWLAVKTSLRSKFAQTIAVCLALSDTVELPACRLLGPLLSATLGKDLEKWSHCIISTTIKFIAVYIATCRQLYLLTTWLCRGHQCLLRGLSTFLGSIFTD